MLRGLPASIALHLAVIGAGYIVLPAITRPIDQASAIVPIELVEVSEVTNIAPAPRIEEEAEPEETPPPIEEFLEDVDSLPAEEVVEADEPPPPPPEEAPPEEPEPEPEPEPQPEEDEPEPEPEEDRPILQPEPEDPLADVLGDASSLFDRTPRDQRQSPPTPREEPELEDEQPRSSEQRRGAGDMSGNTASVVAMIQSQMYVCWDDVVDLPNPGRLNVTVRMVLNPDGTLRGPVELVEPRRAPIGDRAMQVAIERAIRAVQRCAPYRLPAEAQDYYEDWDEVTLNIGPAYRE